MEDVGFVLGNDKEIFFIRNKNSIHDNEDLTIRMVSFSFKMSIKNTIYDIERERSWCEEVFLN